MKAAGPQRIFTPEMVQVFNIFSEIKDYSEQLPTALKLMDKIESRENIQANVEQLRRLLTSLNTALDNDRYNPQARELTQRVEDILHALSVYYPLNNNNII